MGWGLIAFLLLYGLLGYVNDVVWLLLVFCCVAAAIWNDLRVRKEGA